MTVELVARRFAKRLNLLLDELGYPVAPAARCQQLAATAELDVAVASSFLGGYVLPDLPALLALCSLFDREPGYFLDKSPPSLLPGTKIANSLTPGSDPIVIRLPDAMTPSTINYAEPSEFDYLRAPGSMAEHVWRGDLLIAAKVAPWDKQFGFQAHTHYLLEWPAGFQLGYCEWAFAGRAHFFLADGARETLSQSQMPFDGEYAGRVLAQLRGANYLPPHGAASGG